VQQQRELANAIKNAREMALLPYTKRVASVGRGGPRGPRGPRTEEMVDQVTEVEIDDIDDVDTGVEVESTVDTDGEEA